MSCLRLRYLAFLLLLLQPVLLAAQSWTAHSFTADDGLPGNNLNNMLRDKRGFIWIASEAGLVRFDGNRFRVYRVADGLPDNEVVQLCIDAGGILWVLPYREYPVFYNSVTDRFERGVMDSRLRGLSAPEGSMDALEDGGIAVHTTDGSTTIVRNRQVALVDMMYHNPHASPAKLAIALGSDQYLMVSADSLRIFRRGYFSSGQSAVFPAGSRPFYRNHALYACDTNGVYKAVLQGDGRILQVHSNPLITGPAHLSFAGAHLALVSDNGTSAVLLDTTSLAVVATLPLNGALASDVLEDGEGHIWISTIGQGLIRLSLLPVTGYNHLLPPDMAPGTVAIDGPVFLCGDNKGRVVIFRKGCVEKIIYISKWSKAVSRIRNILVLKDGYYLAVEGDASIMLDKNFNISSVYNRPFLNYTDRCAALWHDSIILAGSHTRAVRLDHKSCRAYDTVAIRTTAIGADASGRSIIGASDGCYRKDDTGIFDFGKRYPQLANRVTDICTTPDGLTWIGLADRYLVAIRGDRIAGVLPFGSVIPGNVCNALCTGHPGELWAGTDAGLSRIIYSNRNGLLQWHASSFGAADGVPGQVSDIAWQQDSIYIATTNGVYVMPANTTISAYDIPIFITGIRINDRDTFLQKEWSLPYSMNDLDIRYAGIDMNGYAPVYQYRINGEEWQDAGGDHLLLKHLSPGSNRIEIRALRRDGSPSAFIATLQIHLQRPFWMSAWFRLFIICIMSGLVALLVVAFFRRKREKQLRRIRTEHDLITSQQQTFSALMNPHFIFNALNSIQHYVLAQDKLSANRYLSGFGRLIRMNFESAQKSYISLEEELERLQLYLSLEKMRFGDKLSYTIDVAEDIIPEDWQLPAMILQPYLENALLHGIAPAKIDGCLEVRISRKADDLLINICDNGIGIANSQQNKQQAGHTSRSMDLIRKRLKILEKLHGQSIRIDVTPLDSSDRANPGTCVYMIFPESHSH